MLVSIGSVHPNPSQPRKEFDPVALQELADSIYKHGIIQPIVVEPDSDTDTYTIVDGERRWRSASIAGLTHVPVSVRTEAKGDQERLLLALIANVQRADLNPIDEARAYQTLREDFGMSVQEISRNTGKAFSHIANRLMLLELDEEIQDLVSSRKLYSDPRVAKAIRDIPEKNARIALATRAAAGKYSIKAVITAAKNVKEAFDHQAPKSKKDDTPAISLGLASKTNDLPKWDALAQVGRVPPWEIVEQAARGICGTCTLRSLASASTCRDCPLPASIARMIDLATSAPIPASSFLAKRPVRR